MTNGQLNLALPHMEVSCQHATSRFVCFAVYSRCLDAYDEYVAILFDTFIVLYVWFDVTADFHIRQSQCARQSIS